jgi:hypothetical protein
MEARRGQRTLRRRQGCVETKVWLGVASSPGGASEADRRTYLKRMPPRPKIHPSAELVQEWKLSPSATLGSSVRAKGILLEARANLPVAVRKMLTLEAGMLALRKPEDIDHDLRTVAETVSKTLEGAEALPVIPREVEDILTISSPERHRWLKDGRLQSAGTRTVKLRGRARKITFHVFDTRHIEDVLDRDLVTVWREEDALTAADNRRRAAGKAALARAQKRDADPLAKSEPSAGGLQLQGWDNFDADGLLR